MTSVVISRVISRDCPVATWALAKLAKQTPGPRLEIINPDRVDSALWEPRPTSLATSLGRFEGNFKGLQEGSSPSVTREYV